MNNRRWRVLLPCRAVSAAHFRLFSHLCDLHEVSYVQGICEILTPFILLAHMGSTPASPTRSSVTSLRTMDLTCGRFVGALRELWPWTR